MLHVRIDGPQLRMLGETAQQVAVHGENRRRALRRQVDPADEFLSRRLDYLQDRGQCVWVRCGMVRLGGLQDLIDIRREFGGEEREEVKLLPLAQGLIRVDDVPGNRRARCLPFFRQQVTAQTRNVRRSSVSKEDPSLIGNGVPDPCDVTRPHTAIVRIGDAIRR